MVAVSRRTDVIRSTSSSRTQHDAAAGNAGRHRRRDVGRSAAVRGGPVPVVGVRRMRARRGRQRDRGRVRRQTGTGRADQGQRGPQGLLRGQREYGPPHPVRPSIEASGPAPLAIPGSVFDPLERFTRQCRTFLPSIVSTFNVG